MKKLGILVASKQGLSSKTKNQIAVVTSKYLIATSSTLPTEPEKSVYYACASNPHDFFRLLWIESLE